MWLQSAQRGVGKEYCVCKFYRWTCFIPFCTPFYFRFCINRWKYWFCKNFWLPIFDELIFWDVLKTIWLLKMSVCEKKKKMASVARELIHRISQNFIFSVIQEWLIDFWRKSLVIGGALVTLFFQNFLDKLISVSREWNCKKKKKIHAKCIFLEISMMQFGCIYFNRGRWYFVSPKFLW